MFHFVAQTFSKAASMASNYRDGREKSFDVNRVEAREYARNKWAIMLLTVFEADTPQEVAVQAAAALGVSDRQVVNWLKGESSPAFEHVVAVGTMLGIWKTMEIMTGDKTRDQVAKMIGQ